MFGFVNGLAIIIFMSQLEQFKIIVNGQSTWLSGEALYVMLGLVALTVAIVMFAPKVTKAVPASLIAIIVVFVLVYFFGIETKTVKDIASISGGFPPFHIPNVPVTWETLKVIFPYSLIMAAVGLTEGLLTLNLVDEITGTKGKGKSKPCDFIKAIKTITVAPAPPEINPGLPPNTAVISPAIKAAYKPVKGGNPAKIANDKDSGIMVIATVRPARISVL
jgi:hypothetical protein